MRLVWIEKKLYYGKVQATYLISDDGRKILYRAIKHNCSVVLGSVLGKHSDVSFDLDASCVHCSEEISDELAEQLMRLSRARPVEDDRVDDAPWHMVGGNVDILSKTFGELYYENRGEPPVTVDQYLSYLDELYGS